MCMFLYQMKPLMMFIGGYWMVQTIIAVLCFVRHWNILISTFPFKAHTMTWWWRCCWDGISKFLHSAAICYSTSDLCWRIQPEEIFAGKIQSMATHSHQTKQKEIVIFCIVQFYQNISRLDYIINSKYVSQIRSLNLFPFFFLMEEGMHCFWSWRHFE